MLAKYDAKFRERYIHEVIKKIIESQKKQKNSELGSIVQLVGNIGVGKSAVMSQAVHFMLSRKYFTGGIIVLDLKRIKNFTEFRRKLEL